MIPEWVVFAALGGLASNIFNFFNRYFLKDEGDALSWAWFFESIRLIFFIVASIFDSHLILNFTSLWILFWVGITELLSVYFYMKMHAYSHLSISTILSRTRMIWIPILAFIFLKEHLSIIQYIGIVTIFIGLSFVVAPHKLFMDKGAVYANLAAFFTAINTLFLKAAIPFASTSLIMVTMSLFACIFFPFFMKGATRRIKREFTKHFFVKIFAILLNIISSYLLLFALQKGTASQANAIYQGVMIVSVLGGIIILKERRDAIKKLIGTAVTILGITMLT